MNKIILCILLFATFIYALNCEPLTEEQKETMASEYEIPVIINSGIMCDDGIYFNATSILFVNLCTSFNNKTNTLTTIVGLADKRIKEEYIYDEFGIAIKESNETTSQTCADLYKKFKKEMR